MSRKYVLKMTSTHYKNHHGRSARQRIQYLSAVSHDENTEQFL